MCLVRVMIRVGALDHPVARSSHAVPTPKGGGVGIAAAYGIGTAWLTHMHPSAAPVAALLLALVSYLDDVWSWPFVAKLAAQAAASIAVVLASDRLGDIDFGGWSMHFPATVGTAMTIAWLLFVTNAVNFIDGLNGLASGVAALAAGALGLAAPGLAGAQALPLAAGVVGFLPFNYPRARIFMGDVGSQLCGFVVADLAVRAASSRSVSLVVPLALLPVLADVALTLVRRAAAGERLTQAHRGHFYQVAHRAGIGAARIAALYWGLTAWGALCGVAAGRIGAGPVTGDMATSIAALALTTGPIFLWFAYVVALARKAGITRW